ncbi:MAG: PQQ-binding-like beta-propeller repeat protein [Sphingomonadaceae bacterium]
MRKILCWAASAAVLSACGGGSSPTPTPAVPPPPAPSVKLLSASPVRVAAAHTGLSLSVQLQPSFTPVGTLYVQAVDKAAVIQSSVSVSSNGDGSYALALDTIPALAAGHYTGDLTLKLCSDASCATPQAVPSVTLPYDLTVLAAGNAWPGDKLSALTPWSGVDDWATFQGNAAHTAYVPVTLDPDRFALRWKSGPISSNSVSFYGYAATLVTADGLLYAAANNKLQARKEFDGSTAWTYDVSSLRWPSVNPPAVAGGMVYMAAGQQESTYLFGLEAATGTLKFKTPMSSQWENYLAPVALEGAVYTNAGSYGGLYAFNTSGERLFFGELSQTSMWSPAVDGSFVYAYTGDSLTLFDRKTGAVSSKISDTQFTNYIYQLNGAVVLGTPGTAFGAGYATAGLNGGTMGNSLLKFNTAKGYIDWRISGNYPLTPAYADGVLYAPNTNPYRIEARAEADGALRWSWTPPVAGDSGWAGEPLVTKNLLFVSASSATYAIDLRSHKVVWSYPAAGKLALSRQGVLYIQNSDALVAVTVK